MVPCSYHVCASKPNLTIRQPHAGVIKLCKPRYPHFATSKFRRWIQSRMMSEKLLTKVAIQISIQNRKQASIKWGQSCLTVQSLRMRAQQKLVLISMPQSISFQIVLIWSSPDSPMVNSRLSIDKHRWLDWPAAWMKTLFCQSK